MSHIGWYFKYGNYTHADAEVWFNEDRSTAKSPEGIPMFDTVRWDLHVFIQRDTAALLKSAEIAMEKAYSLNGQNCGFYNDGGATFHTVRNLDTIRGVRVIRKPFFPESQRAEGVRWRNIGITLEWEEPRADVGTLLSWEHSVRIVGTGGPDWSVEAMVQGPPIIMPKTEQSKIVVVQSGRGVGLGYYPPPATPIWQSEPPLHGPSAIVDRITVPGPARERIVVWNYTFMFTQFGSGANYKIPNAAWGPWGPSGPPINLKG